MTSSKNDPTEPIRLKASRYPDVDEGTACTQTSFKVGEKAFLFVGTQGGRYKAMFKLEESKPEARKLAIRDPDRFGVGSTSWVTARFTAEDPLPEELWERWLDESYELSLPKGKKKKATARKKTTGKKVAKKVSKKKVSKKKTTKKAAVRKKAVRKKAST